MRRIHSALFAGVIALGAACSVKETREDCPSLLTVDVSGCLPQTKELTLSAWKKGRVFTDEITVADFPDGYARRVPKGQLRLSAVSGVRAGDFALGDWLLPQGSACDSIWSCSTEVFCTEEETGLRIQLRQQFATVHLSIENLPEDVPYPYWLHLRSEVDGFTLPDCRPHSGEWSRMLILPEDGSYRFRIPRQQDGSLRVDLMLDGKMVESYPIGEKILHTGYDWEADTLKDIFLRMDASRENLIVSVEEWNKGNTYETEI